MPDTVEDLLNQLNRTKEALNGSYCDGELSKCDDLNTEAWSLFARYMLALAERETFKNLRDSFGEKYAAATPKEDTKDLPERITSLLDQINAQLAGIDAQADSLNYDQATKDLNALFSGNLADLQKAVGSYETHYADYDKNRKAVGDDYDLYMANISLYPESLNSVGKKIADAESAMTKAEESGDYAEALKQQGLLAAALGEAETGLESHNADLKLKYEKQVKELDERWQKLLDASPQIASAGDDSGDADDDGQKLKSLETEIVNGFAEAAQNAKQPPYDLAFDELEKVDVSLAAYEVELAGVAKAATGEQDKTDYLALEKELEPKVTGAVELPYEVLKEKNQPIHDRFGEAEALAADGAYAEATKKLGEVKSALETYESALAKLDQEMMEFVEKEDQWKKAVGSQWTIFERYPSLSGKWEKISSDVLESASAGEFASAEAMMDGYLAQLHKAVVDELAPINKIATGIDKGTEPGLDAERDDIVSVASEMNDAVDDKDYDMALKLMWDLDSMISEFNNSLGTLDDDRVKYENDVDKLEEAMDESQAIKADAYTASVNKIFVHGSRAIKKAESGNYTEARELQLVAIKEYQNVKDTVDFMDKIDAAERGKIDRWILERILDRTRVVSTKMHKAANTFEDWFEDQEKPGNADFILTVAGVAISLIGAEFAAAAHFARYAGAALTIFKSDISAGLDKSGDATKMVNKMVLNIEDAAGKMESKIPTDIGAKLRNDDVVLWKKLADLYPAKDDEAEKLLATNDWALRDSADAQPKFTKELKDTYTEWARGAGILGQVEYEDDDKYDDVEDPEDDYNYDGGGDHGDQENDDN